MVTKGADHLCVCARRGYSLCVIQVRWRGSAVKPFSVEETLSRFLAVQPKPREARPRSRTCKFCGAAVLALAPPSIAPLRGAFQHPFGGAKGLVTILCGTDGACAGPLATRGGQGETPSSWAAALLQASPATLRTFLPDSEAVGRADIGYYKFEGPEGAVIS